ncbi:heme ABC exporter ATP-binding protein CcmA [Devosia nitrariae]|uniref:Cytochrome c biogenesis ATP-binding export protein CcmA n=1 Tax=Devosia nitrariae TaxID=2071872 RepID=A0ABQ5W453_9HYPH|nr:heme ABC exporter ATP-binding protein CcmA [Devosia nitrariae]GLQ54466.1 cytochrome c biogenesis ATP-binding export protein CcmA [Devosia nitrariae]
MTLRQGFDPLILTATGLACRRGERVLAEGLEFTVPSGGILLLKGANGAGKTTLLMTLLGALRPASGRFAFEGVDTESAFIHFLGHRNAVKPHLTLAENLAFWASVNGGGGLSSPAALEAVGLGPVAGLDAGYLSAGQTRRLALARLLVTPRPVWLLDEPTAALDTQGEAMVAALIDAHLTAGGLAVAATHLPLPLRSARVGELRLDP